MTRLSIVHKTAYKYNRRVTLSYNEARMTPLTDGQQVVLEASLKVSPNQASVSNYRDYWGTRVTAFDMQMPHESLEVLATATVEVHRTERVATEDDIVGWDVIASEKVQDEFSDWLPQSRLSGPGEEVLEIIPDIVKGKNPPRGRNGSLCVDGRRDDLHEGHHGGVTTNAEQAWSQRQGVCQDLAHLAIGALRCSGIPARYVSGYIHPRSSADIGETVAGQSHAWLEWWDGEWRSWDPHQPQAGR